MPYIGNIVQDFSVSTAMLNTDSVTSIKVLDGTIVNADINDSAAIAGTKISPDFGSQQIITTSSLNVGTINASSNADQILNLNSSDNGAVYLAYKRSGARKAYIGYGGTGDTLNLVNEISDGDIVIAGNDGGSNINMLAFDTSENGRATFIGNVNVGAGLDVIGDINCNGTIDLEDASSIKLGTDDDFVLSYDNTNNQALIAMAAGKRLKLKCDSLHINNAADNSNILLADDVGAVSLFFGTIARIATTSTGISVTGGILATSTGNASLILDSGTGGEAGNQISFIDFKLNGSLKGNIAVNEGTADNPLELNSTGSAGPTHIYGDGSIRVAASSTGVAITGNTTLSEHLILEGGDNQDHPYIELHSNAANVIKYRIINGQSWNPDALLIYDIDNDNTRLTIEQNGLGINRGANSITHGLDVGGTAIIRGNTQVLGTITTSVDGNQATQGGAGLVMTHATNTNLRANHFIVDDFPSGNGTYFIQATESGVSNERHICMQGYGGKVKIGNQGTAPEEKLDVEGNIKIRGGDLKISNGRGIDFSDVTGSASGSASSLLDDYEEGTWTPIVHNPSGITLTTANGQYRKIGKQVFAAFEITFPATSGNDHLILAGLPFTTGNSSQSNCGGVAKDYQTVIDISDGPIYHMPQNNTQIQVYRDSGQNMLIGNVSGGNFRGLAIYFVT